jgi:hypothetical protein
MAFDTKICCLPRLQSGITAKVAFVLRMRRVFNVFGRSFPDFGRDIPIFGKSLPGLGK